MTDSSPMKTPMATRNLFGANPSGKSIDQKTYKSIIGSLWYLTPSRPNIMFATCFVLLIKQILRSHTLLLPKGSYDISKAHKIWAFGI